MDANTSGRFVPDGTIPVTIWHGEIQDDDEGYWLTQAAREIEQLHANLFTYQYDGARLTLALLPPVSPATVEAAVTAAARWCTEWRVTPTWEPEPDDVRIQEIGRQVNEARLLGEADEIAQGWKHVRITSPDRPDAQEAFAADTEVQAGIYRAARSTGVMRRLSHEGAVTIVAFGNHKWPVDGAVATFLAMVHPTLPDGWTIDSEGR